MFSVEGCESEEGDLSLTWSSVDTLKNKTL